MRRAFLWLSLALCLVRPALSQCIRFTSNMAAYHSISSDGTYVYTSVTMDGSENMVIDPVCAPYLPQYQHWPIVYNFLSAPGVASVGGWLTGYRTCPSCYLSLTNNQQIAVPHGTTVTFSWETDGECSSGATFWGASGTLSLSPAFTTGELGAVTYGASGPLGVYFPACLPGKTPVCGANSRHSFSIQYAEGETPWEYASNAFLAVKTNGVVTECIAWPLATPEAGPGPCW